MITLWRKCSICGEDCLEDAVVKIVICEQCKEKMPVKEQEAKHE